MFTIDRIDAVAATLSEPDAPLWERARSLKVTLVPAPAVMLPSSSNWSGAPFGLLPALGFQALHNGSEVALRLAWEAPSPSHAQTAVPAEDVFPDAAALLFPLHPNAPIFMGATGAPVCMWHWKADTTSMATLATAQGIGTTRVLAESDVAVTSCWSDGFWRIVFRRGLLAGAVPDDQPVFSPAGTIRVGFAVWDGSRQEHAGMKAFSPNWVPCTLAS